VRDRAGRRFRRRAVEPRGNARLAHDAVAPAASTLRRIAPTLCGSSIPSRTTISGAASRRYQIFDAEGPRVLDVGHHALVPRSAGEAIDSSTLTRRTATRCSGPSADRRQPASARGETRIVVVSARSASRTGLMP